MTDTAGAEENQQPAQAGNQNQNDANEQPKISRRQQKRQAKMERHQEFKKARREAEKQEKHKAMEQKRAAIDSMLEAMTEEERKQWHEKNKEKRQQAAEARAAVKAKHQQALSSPHKLVIDLGFSELMTPGEHRSLCQQLSYSYHVAVNSPGQLHLHLLGAAGALEASLHRQLPGHVHWCVTKSEKDFREFFKDRLQDLVYLTADSPHELSHLDTSKVYILGGLVDRNRHKGLCFERAQKAGIATARLPIAQHVKLHTSAVMTVNQVVDIMARMSTSHDWRAVLEAVLPCRKRADGAPHSSSKEQSPAPPAGAAAATGSTEAATAAAAAAGAAGEGHDAAAAAAAGSASEAGDGEAAVSELSAGQAAAAAAGQSPVCASTQQVEAAAAAANAEAKR